MNLKAIIIFSVLAIGITFNSGWFFLNQIIAEPTENSVKNDDVSKITAEAEFVITQKDEDEIIRLVEDYNNCVDSIQIPASSATFYGAFQECDAYKKLLKYDYKLIPYLIRQNQIEKESRVIVGSSLADRHIADLEDLQNYQRQRSARLIDGVKPWFKYPELPLDQIVNNVEWYKVRRNPRTRFSWLEWWDDNKDRFIFKTDKPITIETEYKYYNHPHISTQVNGGLLDIEAVSATYRHIIERAAAELGVNVFIGEQQYIRHLTTVRMRGVTFEEFTYLIGRTVYVRGFEDHKDGDKYHFGDETEAEPREILDGWGIMMDKTVFREGDDIPVTIITRDTGDLVYPIDPELFGDGNFKITTNDGNIIKDYGNLNKIKPAKRQKIKSTRMTRVELNLNEYCQLKPGEYNVRFKYLSNETPSVAIEIY